MWLRKCTELGRSGHSTLNFLWRDANRPVRILLQLLFADPPHVAGLLGQKEAAKLGPKNPFQGQPESLAGGGLKTKPRQSP